MAGAVITGDAGSIEHGHDRPALESEGLVEGSGKRRRSKWSRPGADRHGHPGGHRHRVLLGYAHVEEPVGEAGL
jgi:hypothetical protein